MSYNRVDTECVSFVVVVALRRARQKEKRERVCVSTASSAVVATCCKLSSLSGTILHHHLRDVIHMYLVHFSTVTVSQNAMIPCTSSALFCGFTSRRRYSFSSCQRFSIGFRSGLSGGVLHQLTPSSWKN